MALVGKLSLLSKRDTRSIVERLGGTFAPDVTPRTTVVVTAGDMLQLPPHVQRVLSEDELCREAGLPDPATLREHYYSARDLRGMYPVIRDEHLRYLEKLGSDPPGRGAIFVRARARRQAGRGRAAARRPAGVGPARSGVGGPRPAGVRLPTAAIGARARARGVAARAEGRRDAVVSAERSQEIASANYALAAKYFLEGAELDDGEERNLEAAAAAYRRALLFDPHLVPALVNLANVHYERDELVEAEALYEKAGRVDAECFEACFNLGNIHHDLARYNEAVSAYRDALAINPGYPEAHFYLAVTLEKLGRSVEAKPHWKQYRELAPDGEFADLAKEFSD